MSYLDEFLEFLAIPSVSTLPENKKDIEHAAKWLAERMKKAGVEDVRIIQTAGHPTIYGMVRAESSDAPTILLYGHYDVQPPDPLEGWLSPPFEPEIRDGKIYARGASDDKGGVFGAVVAIETMLKNGPSPLNIKFFFEGEEETGSPNALQTLKTHKELFAADVTLSVDGGGFSPESPSVGTGTKGICGVEIEVSGPATDLHSGQAGQVVNNPLNALAEIIASMKHPDGKIAVEGFYDSVIPLTPEEREAFKSVPITDEDLKRAHGVIDLYGESDYTAIERAFARPTLDVNGMWGGFQGAGTKTVIPSKAFCKITCRLVLDQEPKRICELIEEHVKRHTPKGVTAKVTAYPMGVKAYLIPLDHPAIKAQLKVLREVYAKEPVIVRSGGTLPVARMFLDTLDSHLIAFGAGGPGNGVHAPNEFLRLEEFERFQKTLPLMFQELARALAK